MGELESRRRREPREGQGDGTGDCIGGGGGGGVSGWGEGVARLRRAGPYRPSVQTLGVAVLGGRGASKEPTRSIVSGS